MSDVTYETACARIEAIVARLDSGEAGLRETLQLCQEGRRLVEFCAAELDAVGRGLEELRLDELVARVEAWASTAGWAGRRGSGCGPPRRGRGRCLRLPYPAAVDVRPSPASTPTASPTFDNPSRATSAASSAVTRRTTPGPPYTSAVYSCTSDAPRRIIA